MAYPQTSGFLLLMALHAAFVLLPGFSGPGAAWAGLKPEAGYLLIGVVQLLYAVPVTLLLLKLRRPAVALGVVKGAAATFVVNLAGCAIFLSQLSRIDG